MTKGLVLHAQFILQLPTTSPTTQPHYVYVSGPVAFAIMTGATFMWLLFALFFWGISTNEKDGGSQMKAMLFRIGMWMGLIFAAFTFLVGFIAMASEWF